MCMNITSSNKYFIGYIGIGTYILSSFMSVVSSECLTKVS